MKNRIVSTLFLLALTVSLSVIVLSVNIEPAQSSTTNVTLSGHVYDAQGNAAPRAISSLVDIQNGRSAAYCYADSSGFYSLTVPAGTYTLLSYLTGSALTYSQRNMNLNSDTTRDVKLVVGNSVTGHVYNPSGQIVAGAQTVVSNSTWLVPGVNTDASGYYSIYVPNGTYTFALWPPANSNLMNFRNESVTITSDLTYDIVMDSGYIVSGNVQYPSGSKAPRISTALINATGHMFSSGRWSDTMPTPGTYSVAVPAGIYTLQSTLNSIVVYSEPNILVNGDIIKDVTLITVSISPSSTLIDAGQNCSFTASAAGGSGSYISYTWSVDGYVKATTSTPTFNFTPTQEGAYQITAVVKDSRGASSVQSTTAIVTANPELSPPQLSATPNQLDQGQTSVLTATEASGGTGSYSYQWYVKAPSAASYSLLSGEISLDYTFTTSTSTEVGKWSFVLNTTDTATSPNTVPSKLVTVTVNKAPSVAVIPELAIVNEGSPLTFTALVSGGAGSITYEWFMDNTKVGENSTSYTYIAAPGSHSVYVKVTDSANPPLSATSNAATISTNPPLVAPSVSAINSVIDQGQPFKLNSTTPVNGTAPYMYQWFVKAPNGDYSALSGATSATCSIHTANNITAGVWYLVLHITDSATTPSTVASNVIAVTVNTAPSVIVSPSSAAFTVGQSNTFTATAAGGSGSYAGYQWYVNGTAQQGQNSTTFTFSPSSTGAYSITATVTDSLGATSNMSAASQVQTSPAPTPTPTPAPTQTLSPTSNPTASPNPPVTATPNPTETQNPTATPSPTPTQNVTQGPETGTYIIIVVALAVVVAVLVGVIVTSKKNKKK